MVKTCQNKSPHANATHAICLTKQAQRCGTAQHFETFKSLIWPQDLLVIAVIGVQETKIM